MAKPQKTLRCQFGLFYDVKKVRNNQAVKRSCFRPSKVVHFEPLHFDHRWYTLTDRRHEREVQLLEQSQPRPAKRGKTFRPPPPDEFRDCFTYIEGPLLLGVALVMVWFLVIMAAEGLHWATGGKTPELIEWQPHNPHPHGKP